MSYSNIVEKIRNNRDKELADYKKVLHNIHVFFPFGGIKSTEMDSKERGVQKKNGLLQKERLLLCEFPYHISTQSIFQVIEHNFKRHGGRKIIHPNQLPKKVNLNEAIKSSHSDEVKSVQDALLLWCKIRPNRSKLNFINKLIESGAIPTLCQTDRATIEAIHIEDLPLIFKPACIKECIEIWPIIEGTKKVYLSHLNKLTTFLLAVSPNKSPQLYPGISLEKMAFLFDAAEKQVLHSNEEKAFRSLLLLRLLFTLGDIPNEDLRNLKWHDLDEKRLIIQYKKFSIPIAASLIDMLKVIKEDNALYPRCPIKQNLPAPVQQAFQEAKISGTIKELKASLPSILNTLGLQRDEFHFLERR